MFMYVVTIVCSFPLLCSIPLFEYITFHLSILLLRDNWAVSSMELWQTVLLCTFLCPSSGIHVQGLLQYTSPRVELLVCKISTFSNLLDKAE